MRATRLMLSWQTTKFPLLQHNHGFFVGIGSCVPHMKAFHVVEESGHPQTKTKSERPIVVCFLLVWCSKVKMGKYISVLFLDVLHDCMVHD